MDSNAALIRLKEFQIDGQRRKIAQIQIMIAEFERLAADLDREIQAEERRSGNRNPTHFAYSTYAKAARQRRDNLKRSTEELELQRDAARRTLAEAIEDLDAMSAAHSTVTDAMRAGGQNRSDLTRAS